MSPLFMDTGYEPNSPGSLSAECNSNTAGSEREGEGQGTENRGTKRRQKNREAARKSRKKQTERADELHEELQKLEQSNSAFQKEIAALKKEVLLYTTALDRHEPSCCLRASRSSSSNCLSVSPSSVDATLPHNCSSPPQNPPRTTCSSLAAVPLLSTSSTPSLGHHTHDCLENTRLSPSPSSGSPAELFTTSSSSTAMAVSFSVAAPHSLFSEEPPSLIASRPTNAALTSLCASLISNPISPAVAQPPSEQDIHERSSASTNALLHINGPTLLPSSHPTPSTPHSPVPDAFLMKASFQTASSNAVPPYSHLRPPVAENTGLAAQGFSMNVPKLHPCQFSRNPKLSSPPCIVLPSPLQEPALQSLSVSQQANQNPSPARAFEIKSSYIQQMTPTPASLLSLLTVPSPLNVPQPTSRSFDGLLAQPPSSLPLLGDPLSDVSLSELLEVNDWILSGNSNL